MAYSRGRRGLRPGPGQDSGDNPVDAANVQEQNGLSREYILNKLREKAEQQEARRNELLNRLNSMRNMPQENTNPQSRREMVLERLKGRNLAEVPTPQGRRSRRFGQENVPPAQPEPPANQGPE